MVFNCCSDCYNCPHPITLMPTSLWIKHPVTEIIILEKARKTHNLFLFFGECPSDFPTICSSFLFFLVVQILPLKHLSLLSKLLLLSCPFPPSTKFGNLCPHFQQLDTSAKALLDNIMRTLKNTKTLNLSLLATNISLIILSIMLHYVTSVLLFPFPLSHLI